LETQVFSFVIFFLITMTDLLYLNDSYLRECEALVEYVDGTSIVIDRTVLYPQGGGQPTDTGLLVRQGDNAVFKVTLVRKQEGHVVHTVDKPGLAVGDSVKVVLDWEPRYRLMRMHTAAHLLAAIGHRDLGLLITGNQLGIDKSRIDFNLENCDRTIMENLVRKANELIAKGAAVSVSFLPREEALKMPSIVKLANALPPAIDILRIVTIGDPAQPIDTQADGGTHVKDIRDIGAIRFLAIDNKGKSNRRLYFAIEP
jgi:Ser-tRNA(Ala) deacylase AlaX